MNNLKFIFWGTENFAQEILKILIKNNFIPQVVITPPDKKVGRKQELQACPVKKLAKKHNIEVWQPEKIKNNQELYNKLIDLNADLFIVAQYGKILPSKILNIPKHKSINVHGSLLPKYRGAAPVQFALLNNEKITGITLIQMDEKMDHGPILAQQELNIDSIDNSESLLNKLAIVGAYLLIKTIPKYIYNKIDLQEQNHSQATFTKFIKKSDGLINWNNNGQTIINQLRAYTPWPGIYTFINDKRLKILEADWEKAKHNEKNGKIIFAKDHIKITVPDGFINVYKLQLAGKQAMTAKNFINGYQQYNNKFLK